MKNDFDQLEKLLNLLSFKLDHKDYVAAFNLIYGLKLGDLTKEEVIYIFKKVFGRDDIIETTMILLL